MNHSNVYIIRILEEEERRIEKIGSMVDFSLKTMEDNTYLPPGILYTEKYPSNMNEK